MEAQEIVKKLKATPYKFTYAHKVRDEVKTLNDEDCDFLLLELKRALVNPDNWDIRKPLEQIIS
jgi:hypothetical protein